ncbi:hypothetical protein BC835DRAFT_929988 [Cytidiella melzeri]|nr:hypothetical protein BC835DRAFT_929988 [Cytidiella melzeri]
MVGYLGLLTCPFSSATVVSSQSSKRKLSSEYECSTAHTCVTIFEALTSRACGRQWTLNVVVMLDNPPCIGS